MAPSLEAVNRGHYRRHTGIGLHGSSPGSSRFCNTFVPNLHWATVSKSPVRTLPAPCFALPWFTGCEPVFGCPDWRCTGSIESISLKSPIPNIYYEIMSRQVLKAIASECWLPSCITLGPGRPCPWAWRTSKPPGWRGLPGLCRPAGRRWGC